MSHITRLIGRWENARQAFTLGELAAFDRVQRALSAADVDRALEPNGGVAARRW